MIKFFISFLLVVFINNLVIAQKDTITSYQKAQNFMRQGDFANAELVLNKALQQTPNDIDLMRSLTIIYYLQQNFTKALEVGTKLTNRLDADVSSYQALGLVYKAIADYTNCEKLYKKALEEYPNSGLIYCEYGELLKEKNPQNAISLWEKGIQLDPNYTGNYYNASLYYAMNSNWIWALVYGEVFINMESLTARTTQVKVMLFDAYKKLFVDMSRTNSNAAISQENSAFAKAVWITYSKQSGMTNNGITPESLGNIRKQFIKDWYAQGYAYQFPFYTFDYIKTLIQKDMFDAYNQWVFGTASNNTANYQTWMNTHQKENDAFLKYQRGDVLKLPRGQYYKK
jgi:tetratricopeptide (TPR) repeat protein